MVSEQQTSSRAECRQAFGAYLSDAKEPSRAAAPVLARHALEAGGSLSDFMHDVMSAIADAVCCAEGPAEVKKVLDAGEAFVTDCLSPHEAEWRAAVESTRGLRSQNDRMEERVRRIAHEIHDSSAQFLASVHTELHRAAELAPGEMLPRLQRIHTLLNQVEADLHRFSHELRPTILDDLGLVPALHELSRSLGHESGMVIAVEGPDGRYSPAVEIALYRTVQDALSGVEKYGRAPRVNVRVETSESEIRCSIADDGPTSGKAVNRSWSVERGPGLISIRERLATLGGTLSYERRADGRGTRLVASIPLEVGHVASRFGR